MDNSKTQNLDPQLKATYERVMGTNLAPAAAPEATLTPPPAPSAPSAPAIPDAGETKVVAGGGKGGRKVSPILIGIAVVLFFVVYTFIWLKVFAIKIPFLPF